MNMKDNGTFLKIYRGVTIVVLTAGVLSVFNMSGAIIRLEEQMSFVKYRLTAIENYRIFKERGSTRLEER